jgi:hypothetical protein
MNSNDFDRLIVQEQNALSAVKDQGEKLIPEFKRTAASYIRELSINLMKSYFEYKPEIVKSLSPENLENIKNEFTEILDSLPEKTSQRFDERSIWLHRVEIPDYALSDMTYSYQLEQKSKKTMDDAIRELIGQVGTMLKNYGFIEQGKDFTWAETAGGIIQYANDLPSKGMDHYRPLTNLMGKYKDILIEYVYAVQNLRKAEEAKKSAESN